VVRFSFAAETNVAQSKAMLARSLNAIQNCSGSEGGIGYRCARGSITAQLNLHCTSVECFSLPNLLRPARHNFRRGSNFVSS